MEYTNEQIQKIYNELEVISRETGHPMMSMDELTVYLESKPVKTMDKGSQVSADAEGIKKNLLDELGGADKIKDVLDKIKESGQQELKNIADAAAQQEKKLMNSLEHKKTLEAQQKAKEADEVAKEEDRLAYAPSEERKQQPGRVKWNPARSSREPSNLGSRIEREANVKYPETLDENTPVNKNASGSVECHTIDGTLKGHRYVPENANGKVALYFGGNGVPGAASVKKNTAELFKSGTTVVSFDPRGYGKSQSVDKSGQPVETAVSEESMFKDAKEMFRYVVKDMGIKPENIQFCGQGIGENFASRLQAEVDKVITKSDMEAPQKQETVKEAAQKQGASGPAM